MILSNKTKLWEDDNMILQSDTKCTICYHIMLLLIVNRFRPVTDVRATKVAVRKFDQRTNQINGKAFTLLFT